MKQHILSFILCFLTLTGFAQSQTGNLVEKRLAARDSIRIDSVSINPSKFQIKLKSGRVLDKGVYKIDFVTSVLTFKQPIVEL